jgi:D-alanyl-D-alanine carboxypeptidase
MDTENNTNNTIVETNESDKTRNFFVIAILIIIIIFFGVAGKKQIFSNEKNSNVLTGTQNTFWSYIPSLLSTNKEPAATPVTAYDNLNLVAKSAIVWDVQNQKALFQKNGNLVLPIASITKLMTTIVAMENLSKFATIKISSDNLLSEGDTGLLNQEKWTLNDLLSFSLTNSSNDGMMAVASTVSSVINPAGDYSESNFTRLMNKKAIDMGLQNTRFYNGTGLDVDQSLSGGYSNALEISKLMEYAIKNYPDIMEATSQNAAIFSSLSNIKHISKNTNEVVDEIPTIIASKTGFTDLAGGTLVVAFDIGLSHPVIATVLGSGRMERFSDIVQLVQATQKQLLSEKNNSK